MTYLLIALILTCVLLYGLAGLVRDVRETWRRTEEINNERTGHDSR